MRVALALLLLAAPALAGTLEDLLRDLGSPDAGVRAAAVRDLGERDDETSLRALRTALARFGKDPEVLPVVVASLGARGDAASAGAVADLLRKAVGADARLARACIDALGRMRDPAALAGLMELLASTAGGVHGELQEDLLDSLRELTGLPFRQEATWREWWRHARKGWKATPLDPAPGAEVYRSDGWRFSVSVPDPGRWEITRVPGAAARVLFRGTGEEARFAWVDVLGHAPPEGEPGDARKAAEAELVRLRSELRELREEETFAPARLGRGKGFRHEVTGILENGSVVRRRVVCVERNGLLYTLSAGIESGAAGAVRKEWEAVLGSVRLLD